MKFLRKYRGSAAILAKHIFALCLCVLAAAAVSVLTASETGAAPANPPNPPAPPLKTFTKSDYAAVLRESTNSGPNVLFLLDVGSPMVFSPKGIMPLATDGRFPKGRHC